MSTKRSPAAAARREATKAACGIEHDGVSYPCVPLAELTLTRVERYFGALETLMNTPPGPRSVGVFNSMVRAVVVDAAAADQLLGSCRIVDVEALTHQIVALYGVSPGESSAS